MPTNKTSDYWTNLERDNERLAAVNADLVAALEKDIKRIVQLSTTANNLAERLGLGRKINEDSFTANARAALAKARG